MEKGGLTIIFGIFLTIVVGVALLTTLADRQSIITNDIDIINETLTVNVTGFQNATDINTSMPFSLTNENWTTGSVLVYNASNGAVLTATTHYNVDYIGYTINFTNATYLTWTVTNDSLVNYSYYHNDYIDDTTSRTLMSLIPLFFVIGILMFIVSKLMGYGWLGWLGKKD